MVRSFLIVISVILAVGCNTKTERDPQAGGQSKPAIESVSLKLQRAHTLNQQGDSRTALKMVQEILLSSPENIQALGLAVDVHRALGQYREAAELATKIAVSDPKFATVFRVQAFHLYLQSGDYRAAEDSLNRVIELDPNHVEAHRLLAQLLNAQGRRFEASEHVRQLIRLRVVQPNELLSLVDLSGPFLLVSFGSMIDNADTSLFLLGEARQQYAGKSDPQQLLSLLQRVREKFPGSAAAAAFQGRVLAETDQAQQLKQWLTQLPEGIQEQPEYWLAIGTWMANENRHQEAIRALAEAILRDPTNRHALRSMIACLDAIGKQAEASELRKQLSDLDQIFRIAKDANADQAIWISKTLQQLVRPWEAVAWLMLSAQLDGTMAARVPELNQRHAEILAWEKAASAEQIREARTRRLLGFLPQQWPLPDVDSLMVISNAPSHSRTTGLRLTDTAERCGLLSRFESGFPIEGGEFFPYQVNGGGLAAFDYDLDGRCDLYAVQSSGQPNNPHGSTPNQLFRQLPSQQFSEVAVQASADDRGFGQGVCAGDVNQDGFPDLLIANIGKNVLYINQGDGTFLPANSRFSETPDNWTSTIGLADLNGDHLPDIVEINYVNDPQAYIVKCETDYLNCQPQRFRKAPDRVLLCDQEGQFAPWPSVCDRMFQSPKLGFGLIIANFDRRHGNDFFVANDGDFNQFWVSQAPADSAAPFDLVESANLLGCSIGRRGDSQACMGVAAGDFNRDGTLDLHVTNFYREPVNLFLQTRSGNFSDQAASYGLAKPSFDVLGFGTQAADFDNDGWLDLAVVNGHVFDARHEGIPFQMPPQLFLGSPRGFALHDQASAGEYWKHEYVGRTLALLDFNRDGRMDLVANHLDAPTALLQNDSDVQNWLQVELVGVQSERDANGAEIRVQAGQEQWTGWQTGGDGHMCTNEQVIHFGLGQSTSIDRMTIVWPSGRAQVFNDIQPNARYLAIEGNEELFRRDDE